MEGSSNEEEMESVLLPNFDLIYQENAITEIELLKSNSNAELKILEALQFTSHSLRQENERLTRLQSESLHNLADQEHKKSMDLLKRDYMTKVGDLEAQIRREALFFILEKSLATQSNTSIGNTPVAPTIGKHHRRSNSTKALSLGVLRNGSWVVGVLEGAKVVEKIEVEVEMEEFEALEKFGNNI